MLIDTTSVRKWRFWPAVWLGFLLALTIAVLSLAAHQTKHDCGVGQPHQRADNACAPVSADERTADATDWIAAFTIILAVVGGVQGLLIWRQIALARDEFNATHRPKLRIRNINIEGTGTGAFAGNFTLIDHGESILGEYYVSNIGDAPAFIEGAFFMLLGTTRALPMARPYATRPANCLVFKKELAPGEVAYANIDITAESNIFSMADVRYDGTSARPSMINPREHSLYALGWVTYRDGTKILRRTTFARKWSDDARRFLHVEGDVLDYENDE
jgi:hypothetical protein